MEWRILALVAIVFCIWVELMRELKVCVWGRHCVYIDVYHNGYGLRVPPLPALFSGFTPIPPPL